MVNLAHRIEALLAAGQPAALVQIETARGSTPRDSGTMMLVEPEQCLGTIGGGQAELMAIAAARSMLATGMVADRLALPLGPEIGQCCGGHLMLVITLIDHKELDLVRRAEVADSSSHPEVIIYGAGHVGRALAQALAVLPFKVTLVDSRKQEFSGLQAPDVTQLCTPNVSAVAEAAAPGMAHIIVTHSHALDSLIASCLLERGDFAYLGIIGSHTKRQTFERAFLAMGLAAKEIARITCPIGSPTIHDKRPQIIAALTAAELIDVFSKPVSDGAGA